MAPGHLFMLGWSAVPKIIYVRTAGGPENTSSIGENPNINNLTWPPQTLTLAAPADFLSKNDLWHICGPELRGLDSLFKEVTAFKVFCVWRVVVEHTLGAGMITQLIPQQLLVCNWCVCVIGYYSRPDSYYIINSSGVQKCNVIFYYFLRGRRM